ncbi:AzlC family ABC transporter permease [Moraxella sp. ZY210820]|uniref:AzlC family ABC transporter permease n=1 Tax=unclassified Moraxella TaxID=2685852 RepID=UPI00272FE07C|nr:AzlC family ABC transporter permease [Moraxella sp. ZY210820]
MLNKYHQAGWKKYYLIPATVDESFAINYSAKPPPNIDESWHMVYVSLFLHIYWVGGTALGAFLADILPFSLKGSEFAMTALFLVIFAERWLSEKSHESSLIGLAITIICLLLLGKEHFLIPAMVAILLVLTWRRPILMQKLQQELD